MVLSLLRRGPARYTDITRQTGESPGTVYIVLLKLSEEGLVEQLEDKRYRLTERGERLLDELAEALCGGCRG